MKKLTAYRQLLDEKLIHNPHVLYVRNRHLTIVEYDTDRSHEEILKELANRSN